MIEIIQITLEDRLFDSEGMANFGNKPPGPEKVENRFSGLHPVGSK